VPEARRYDPQNITKFDEVSCDFLKFRRNNYEACPKHENHLTIKPFQERHMLLYHHHRIQLSHNRTFDANEHGPVEKRDPKTCPLEGKLR
jgi:hypothetical protein